MEIVGCPVGSERFCQDLVKNTLETMLSHSDDLAQLHPQAASKLLLKCLAPAPGFLSQICHPSVTKKPLEEFDCEIWDLWIKIIGGIGHGAEQLKMCNAGKDRAKEWAHLPTRTGGAGLSRWGTIADYAWYCSLAECTSLQDIDLSSKKT